MPLSPTHRKRSPYLFHFDGQTVALGEPRYLKGIDERLREQGYATRPTYWDQAYLADLGAESPEDLEQNHFREPNDPGQLNSVGVSCSSSEFWSAMYARSFGTADWGGEGETLYMPQLPDWLERTRAWSLDPLAPQDGPGDLDPSGGWVRVRSQSGAGAPLGLFQLTSPDYFWVFGSGSDLKEVVHLCRELGRDLVGFEQATAYLGYDLTCSSIRLPIGCAQPLQEQLFLAGVDAETLLWGEG